MSRMQSILEKAEREGAVRHLRSSPEQGTVAPPAEVGVAAIPAPPATAATSRARATPLVHTSSAIRLNRSLVAASSTNAVKMLSRLNPSTRSVPISFVRLATAAYIVFMPAKAAPTAMMKAMNTARPLSSPDAVPC